MADNYLERQMEDFRNGRKTSHPSSGKSVNPRKPGLFFPLSPKRVLIITSDFRREAIARMFLRAECKVAMMHPDGESGEKMARREGIRYYPLPSVDPAAPLGASQDTTTTLLQKNLLNLLKAWRDIDIIIIDGRHYSEIERILKTHRDKFPYLSDYLTRIIVLGKDKESNRIENIVELKATLNHIHIKNSENDLCGVIGMFILPGNSFLNGMTIDVG